jgi:hypothetical protein
MHRAGELLSTLRRRLAPAFDARRLLVVLPLLPLVFLLPWLTRELNVELSAPLFRDAAMMQYTGWCIRHGMRLYEDAATPDGPFIHFFHALLQVFWGISDEGARRGDLLVQLVGAMLFGAAIAPRPTDTRSRAAIVTVWALLGAFAWLSWYLTGGWEHTVQRDPYNALFGYLGMALLYTSSRFGQRMALTLAFVGGALATSQLFGRQSGIIYPAMALLGLLAEGSKSPLWKQRLVAGFTGAGVAIAGMLVAVVTYGSWQGFLFWYFRVPLDIYRFIGSQPFSYLYTHVYLRQLIISVGIAAGVIIAIGRRLLPVQAVGFALAPFLFLMAACFAGKGWINHVQQTVAAENLVILLALSAAWERGLEREAWSGRQAALGMILLGALFARVVTDLRTSSFNAPPLYTATHLGAERLAEDLARSTAPDDRVFYYAHELHGLLFAERKTALPEISDQVLNFDAWLFHAPPWEPPSDAEMATFERTQALISRDACGRLLNDPPAAVVSAPNDLHTFSVMSFEIDLQTICPAFVPLLTSQYRMHKVAGYQVFLRRDHASPVETPPGR